MFDLLNKLGTHIAGYFGDTDVGHSHLSLEDYNQKHGLFSSTPFTSLLPYEAFDEENNLFNNINSVGFTIEAIPIVGCGDTAYKMLSTLFEDLIEEEASIQCLLIADHRIDPFLTIWETACKSDNEQLHHLSKKRAEYFKTTNLITPRIFRFIISYSTPRKENDPAFLDKIKEKQERFLETLKPITHAFVWKPENLIELVGGIVNFSLSKQIHKRKWNPYQSLASQMGTGGRVSVEKDYLTFKTDTECTFKSYRVTDFPDYWHLNSMNNLIGDFFQESFKIRTPFYIHFGVHCPKKNTVDKSFWRKANLIDHQGKSSTFLRWIPELEKELNDYNYVRREVSQTARFVWTQLSVGLWSPKEKMHQHEEVVKGLFRLKEFALAENTCLHLPQLITCLPMTWTDHINDLKNSHLLRTTITSECTNFVPIQAEWRGTSTPCMLFLGRRGQIINWCPFDNKMGNYNIVVSGKSGSGKSVFMQEIMMNGLRIGAKVFVLDVGRSFERLNEILEGQQIEFSSKSNICLNPFSDILGNNPDALDISLNFLKSIIRCMASPNTDLTNYENAVIENAIRAAWDKKGQEATITDVADWLLEHQDPRAQTVGTILTPYTKRGVYAKFFEGKNNVNINNKMVLIELEELKEKKDLQAVVLQLFIMIITNQAFLGDRKTPFFICIDEAWDLLRSNHAGLFIETLARRLRKYKGSLVVGTQDIDDFFKSPAAKAAYNNSDWKCFFSQDPEVVKRVVDDKVLNLSEGKRIALEDLAYASSPAYREFMLCDAQGGYNTLRLSLDNFTKLLYTTDPDDFTSIRTLRKKGLSITKAIEALLIEKKHV